MSIYDKASLVLIPSGTKTSKVYSQKPTNGDGDFTFSRSTAATRVNASGNIEKETQNLLIQSDWDDVGTGVPPTGWGTFDPNFQAGALTGQIRFITSGNRGYIYQNFAVSTGVYTFSFYVDDVVDPSQISGAIALFGVSNTIITYAKDGVSCSGGEFLTAGSRFSVTANITSAGTLNLRIGAGVTGPTTDDFTLSRPQGEQGLVARDYIETTTTAIYGGITDNVPRLDYTDSSCPALLLEPQRTNVVENSEYHSGSTYANQNVSIVDNDAVSPEGLQNAAKIVLDNGSNPSNGGHSYSFNSTSGTTYTISVFAKAGEYRYFTFTYGSIAAGGGHFDLQEGTLLGTITHPAYSNETASIEDYGNGWYRLVVSLRDNSSATGRFLSMKPSPSASVPANNNYPSTGDGVSGAYIYGFQLEEASYATSYIPTYGSAVTRNADATDDLDTSSLLTQSNNNTFFGEVVNHRNTGNTRFIASYDSARDNGDRILIYTGNGSSDYTLHCQYKVSGETSIQFNIKTNVNYGDTIKFAVVFNGTQMIGFANGVKTATATIVDGDNFNKFDITDVANEGGVYKQLILFPTALTDQEAIDLTTI